MMALMMWFMVLMLLMVLVLYFFSNPVPPLVLVTFSPGYFL